MKCKKCNKQLFDNNKTGFCNKHRDMSGKNHPMFGKHHTKESKEKNHLAHLGKSSPFKNIPLPEKVKRKMRENHADVSGKNNPMYGIHRFGRKAPMFGKYHTEETKEKIRSNHSRRCWMYNKKLKQSRLIKKEEIERYLKDDWILKRVWNISEKTRQKMRENHPDCSGENNPVYGLKWIHNIKLKQMKRVTQNRTQEYLNQGWKLGTGERTKAHIEKNLKMSLKAVSTRPNKFEKSALNYLNMLYQNKFKYTGDGSFIVNRRSADAYAKELNAVALFNGCYWHLKHLGLEINEKNKRLREKIEAAPFLKAGFKVIFIWEDELNFLVEKN